MFAVMLLYPQLSTRILGMLQCRELGTELWVLQSEYSVQCNDNAQYTRFRVGASMMVVLWVIGVPVGLYVWLNRQWRENKILWTGADAAAAQRIAAESGALREELAKLKLSEVKRRAREVGITEQQLDDADDTENIKGTVLGLVIDKVATSSVDGGSLDGEIEDRIRALSPSDGIGSTDNPLSEALNLENGNDASGVTESLAAYNYSKLRQSVGFVVNDYRPECFWYEPIDMIRKLALSGLLQFVQPGTGAQIFFGCVTASVAIGMQLYLCPYREAEANNLKAVVDGHILLTFLVSFMLRVLHDDTIQSFEPLGADFYGWVLVTSLVALISAGIGLTTSQVHRRAKFRSDLMRISTSDSGFGD